LGNELAKCFWKSEVPAHKQPDLAERRIEDLMRICRARSQVLALRMPQILLDIFANHVPIRSNEVAHIQQLVFLILRSVGMAFHNCTRHNADPQFLGKGLIPLQIDLPFIAGFAESLILGDPVGEMVFWEDC